MADKGNDLLKKGIVVDGLFHSLLDDPPPSHVDKTIIDLLLEGGVTVINTSVILDFYKNSFTDYLKQLYRFFILEEAYPDKFILVKKYADILQAKKENKLAVILSMQGADSIEHDLRYITILYRLGVRLIQITYNQRNNLGCGVYEQDDTGLTRFGQQAIYEMNRLGIVVDLSHVGYKTSLDAIEVSKDPVVFSHVSVKSLCEHPRNIKDEQIKKSPPKEASLGFALILLCVVKSEENDLR